MTENMIAHNPLEGDRAELIIDLQDGTDERVSIIVIHKDRPEYLNICLQSIAITSINNNYELIVVDNGSQEQDAKDFLEHLSKEPDVKVIRNERNRWWAAAANQGARAADKASKYLVFMHADVVVTNPAWIDILVNIAEAHGSGCIGLETGTYKFDKRNVDFIQEWCIMISRECWKDCGPYIEELPQVGAPFMFSMTANSRGYKPQVVGRIPIAHHYRIFGLDYNEFEKLSETAMVTIPKIMMELQRQIR